MLAVEDPKNKFGLLQNSCSTQDQDVLANIMKTGDKKIVEIIKEKESNL